jgi:hypothetical protein
MSRFPGPDAIQRYELRSREQHLRYAAERARLVGPPRRAVQLLRSSRA